MDKSSSEEATAPDTEDTSHDATTPGKDDDAVSTGGYSTRSSDSEYQHALEVIISQDHAHRRKSSMVSDEAERLAARKATVRHRTACRVHQILEAERQANKKSTSRPLSTAPLRNVPELPASTGSGGGGEGGENVEAIVRSRLLTKRQLSDMTWGVRQLSKKLGSLRLRLNVKSVFILTKIYDEALVAKSRDLVEWLLSKERQTPYVVYVEDRFEHNDMFKAQELLDNPAYQGRLKYWTQELCSKRPQTFDFAITLGGDGTVLYASALFQRIVPPVLSFSLGSLGFLTKFDFDDYQNTLTNAFRDGVVVSLRLRFEATVMHSQTRDLPGRHDLLEELIGEESEDTRTHRPGITTEILNDIIVDRGPNATMSTIEIFGDDEHFTTVQADGICVATPTGSTAYNLAAGGSLSHPDNPIILVTAISPHTLSFRPIILPDTIILRVGVPYDARTSSWASFDGRERVELKPGDYVTVSASRYPFANVMPEGGRSEAWIQSISRTLQWNSRQRQKAFKQ